MNFYRKRIMLATCMAILMFFSYNASAVAPGPKVSDSALGNKHNLSAASVGVNYKATNDAVNNPRGQQICIFCHTPHSANVAEQAPLWNRAFSSGVSFQRYTSLTLHIRGLSAAQYGTGAQPNGSSKLCLSCHDGVSKMGDLYGGSQIAMVGSDQISGLASFHPDTKKMLTGHHPVSFVYLTGFTASTTPQTGTPLVGLPASYRFMPQSSSYTVKLQDTKRNGNGWMQCTTCHNPHQNQSDEAACYNGVGAVVACGADTRKVAPFWVYHGTNTTASQDSGSVCKVCHALSAPGTYSPWPYPN